MVDDRIVCRAANNQEVDKPERIEGGPAAPVRLDLNLRREVESDEL